MAVNNDSNQENITDVSNKTSSNKVEQGGDRKKITVGSELTNSVIMSLPPELSMLLQSARESRGKNDSSDKKTEATPVPNNLTPDASDLLRDILSADVLTNKSPANEKAILEKPPEQTPKVAPAHIDQQTQDLLRRMVIQEKLTETPSKPTKDPIIPVTPLSIPVIKSASSEPGKGAPPPPPPRTSSSPPPPPRQIQQMKAKTTQEEIIYESGSIWDIQINKTRKSEVINVMTEKSKVKPAYSDSILRYDDVGVVFYFSEGGNLQEITFSYPFEGLTSKGLRIDDSVNKAINLYGQPRMRTPSGAIWTKMAVFLKDDLITTIRLRDS